MTKFLLPVKLFLVSFLAFAFSANAQIKIVPNMGPIKTCAGTIRNFESGYTSAAHMSWAVSGEAEIVTVSGMDVNSLKSANGVPSTAKLQYVFAQTCNWTGTLSANFKLANGGTKTYLLTAGIDGDVTNSKALAISVLFPVAEYSSVSWNGSMGFCGFWGQQGTSKTVIVTGANLPAAANIYAYGFDPNNVPCNQSISMGTDWVDGAKYEWSISPEGAVINGEINTTTLNISSFTNSGTYMVSLKMFDNCGNEKVYQQSLNIPAPPTINLPTNIFSCDNTVEINPTVTGGQAPYTVHWVEFMDGYFEKGTYYTTTSDFSNTFIATKYGNSTVRLRVTGANGCYSTATSNIATLGGYSSENPDVSGWLSGHINPNQPSTVESNLVKAPDYNRIYFVEHIPSSNTRMIKFYEFATDKWILSEPGIVSVFASGDNTIKYFKGSSHDHLFYINTLGDLEVRSIERSTGKAVGNLTSFPSIKPREQTYGYHIQDINGSLFRVFWKDIIGNLYSQVIVYDFALGTYVPQASSLVTISEVDLSGSFTDVVRYDVDEYKNRIFYFKSNGGFYYQDLNNIGIEHQLNGIFSGDFVQQVSDVDFDGDGNVYFAANGDIYFARFDENNNYIGTFKMETTDGITNLTMKSEAKGYFTINRATNVIYYAGGNGNVYQIYRQPNFQTDNTFGIVKATPNTFNDGVSNSLVYVQPHLYYRSSSNQVYNLFYTPNTLMACSPAYMKVAAGSTDVGQVNTNGGQAISSTQLDAPSSTMPTGNLYPNPFNHYLTVDVKGQGTGTLELVESTGRTVLKETYNFSSMEINTSELSPGVYFCKISGENVPSVVFKVIKN